jgi:hypothetical protein
MADDIVDVLFIGSGATGAGDRQALVDGMRALDADFMSRLALETVTCYDQHDRVLAALGMALRSPAPQGFKVISGDLMLLAPVSRRGKMYRDA